MLDTEEKFIQNRNSIIKTAGKKVVSKIASKLKDNRTTIIIFKKYGSGQQRKNNRNDKEIEEKK